MVAIPLIPIGPRTTDSGRTGVFDRFMAWLHTDAATESKPATRPTAARRADFVEYAAMSREMHRL